MLAKRQRHKRYIGLLQKIIQKIVAKRVLIIFAALPLNADVFVGQSHGNVCRQSVYDTVVYTQELNYHCDISAIFSSVRVELRQSYIGRQVETLTPDYGTPQGSQADAYQFTDIRSGYLD